MKATFRYLLRLVGRFAAAWDRRRAPDAPPLTTWTADFERPRVLHCRCGEVAADDEIDLCHRCRARQERDAAELEAHKEERRRRRREAKVRRDNAPVLRMRKTG
jgi:hypothetical protein